MPLCDDLQSLADTTWHAFVIVIVSKISERRRRTKTCMVRIVLQTTKGQRQRHKGLRGTRAIFSGLYRNNKGFLAYRTLVSCYWPSRRLECFQHRTEHDALKGTLTKPSRDSGIVELLSHTEGVIKNGALCEHDSLAGCAIYYCRHLANCHVLDPQKGRDGCGLDWPTYQ